jgi:hypothetical protein
MNAALRTDSGQENGQTLGIVSLLFGLPVVLAFVALTYQSLPVYAASLDDDDLALGGLLIMAMAALGFVGLVLGIAGWCFDRPRRFATWGLCLNGIPFLVAAGRIALVLFRVL